jgi:hypothetical protein
MRDAVVKPRVCKRNLIGRSLRAARVDHDVSQNVDALLQSIEVPLPFELLDLGCGPGRDLKTFTALGHRATGLEGSAQLAALARKTEGLTLWFLCGLESQKAHESW